jgi:hypothetical protein
VLYYALRTRGHLAGKRLSLGDSNAFYTGQYGVVGGAERPKAVFFSRPPLNSGERRAGGP